MCLILLHLKKSAVSAQPTFALVLGEGNVVAAIEQTQQGRQQLAHVVQVHVVAELDQVVQQSQHLKHVNIAHSLVLGARLCRTGTGAL